MQKEFKAAYTGLPRAGVCSPEHSRKGPGRAFTSSANGSHKTRGHFWPQDGKDFFVFKFVFRKADCVPRHELIRRVAGHWNSHAVTRRNMEKSGVPLPWFSPRGRILQSYIVRDPSARVSRDTMHCSFIHISSFSWVTTCVLVGVAHWDLLARGGLWIPRHGRSRHRACLPLPDFQVFPSYSFATSFPPPCTLHPWQTTHPFSVSTVPSFQPCDRNRVTHNATLLKLLLPPHP